MKKIALISLIASFMLIGCTGTKTLTTCKSFENDICVVKKTTEVTECKSPVVIDSKTYCK